MKQVCRIFYAGFIGSSMQSLHGMTTSKYPVQQPSTLSGLSQYRMRNSSAIMLSYYNEGLESVHSFSDISHYQNMRFTRFENSILPACIQELQENQEEPIYRFFFKNMLVYEVHKIVPLLTYLADKFADSTPETPELLQEIDTLQRKLITHEQEINTILDSKQMNYEQLVVHCIQKASIYNALSNLQLSLYKKPRQ